MEAGFTKFTSFNHINDYGEEGFAALDREIASSHPLVLWAPSMAILEDCHHKGICKVSPEHFVRYTEQGFIEVIGREWWLTDKRERERRATTYPGARWTSYDDQLLNILVNFDNRPVSEVHVRIVPSETGYEWAEQVLHEERVNTGAADGDNLPIVRDILGMLQRGEVPAGTAERARRADTSEKQAVEVLRDVKNHTDAYVLADGKGFIMSPEDSRFLQLLERNPNLGAIKAASAVTTVLPTEIYSAEFAAATLSLLERLQNPVRPPRFEQFIGSEAHRDLVAFTGRMYEDAEIVKLEAIDTFLRRELRNKIRDYIPNDVIWPRRLWQRIQVLGKVGQTAYQFARDPTGVSTLGGLGLNVIQLVYRSLQRIGVIADSYSGPQWPFLYMLGRKARRTDYPSLLSRLWRQD